MTGFLRSNRYASAILTTVILVVIGFVVGFTRDTSTNAPDFVLRADEQAVQPGTSETLPSAGVAPQTPATLRNLPPITLGKLGKPAPRSSRTATTNGASRTTTSGTSGGTTPTTGGGATQTTRPPGTAFSANRIAFSAGATLWTINPDGSDPRSVANSGYFGAWSPDRGAIAFADSDRPGGGLSLVEATGETYGLTTGVAADSQPTWSPDGSKVAFARIDGGSDDESGIWIVSRNGSNLRRIVTTPGCFNRDPAWSPNGLKIAFWSSGLDHCEPGAGQGSFELYTVTVSTGEIQRLGTATNSGAPAWSPDGRTIAFSSDGYGGQGFEICVMAADGTDVVRITNLAGEDTDPTWSPDGTRIAFRSDRDGGGIYTMSPNGTGMELVVAGGIHPSWR